jgi:VCBS repeat protein
MWTSRILWITRCVVVAGLWSLAWGSHLWAQTELDFIARRDLRVGGGPSSILVGDFNADGRQDLAVANVASSTISTLLGKEDGTFQAGSEFRVGATPGSMTLGDFNADGRQDLVTAGTVPAGTALAPYPSSWARGMAPSKYQGIWACNSFLCLLQRAISMVMAGRIWPQWAALQTALAQDPSSRVMAMAPSKYQGTWRCNSFRSLLQWAISMVMAAKIWPRPMCFLTLCPSSWARGKAPSS